ncbi:hypothetical protein [Actinoplanes derwentensis]|uniref:Uncharacterized protein n=1 Tax=Actinoplanes derwentensis TaxID=113562 RepID=A0A1H1YI99_9ACTN|nr:hypothetical protein [Actinoplanes derwentensis]SDT21104.1 hypothetical protein SAMN04489716_2863 [Actinoplanes derwentensis]
MTDHVSQARKSQIKTAVLSVVAVVALIIGGLVWLGRPAEPARLPAGESKVDVYLLTETGNWPEATGREDVWFVDLVAGGCRDRSVWYVEYSGQAMCVTPDGPHGPVTVSAGPGRIDVPADAQAAIAKLVAAADIGRSVRMTQVLLVPEGQAEAAGVINLDNPATAIPVD